jgi:hypothetical protein
MQDAAAAASSLQPKLAGVSVEWNENAAPVLDAQVTGWLSMTVSGAVPAVGVVAETILLSADTLPAASRLVTA